MNCAGGRVLNGAGFFACAGQTVNCQKADLVGLRTFMMRSCGDGAHSKAVGGTQPTALLSASNDAAVAEQGGRNRHRMGVVEPAVKVVGPMSSAASATAEAYARAQSPCYGS